MDESRKRDNLPQSHWGHRLDSACSGWGVPWFRDKPTFERIRHGCNVGNHCRVRLNIYNVVGTLPVTQPLLMRWRNGVVVMIHSSNVWPDQSKRWELAVQAIPKLGSQEILPMVIG